MWSWLSSWLREGLWSRQPWTVVSWNVAAINTNPWEYYVDGEPTEVLVKFQEWVGSSNKKISQVLLPAMVEELFEKMEACGTAEVEAAKRVWELVWKERSAVGGFLADADLGAKRLVSMPDRLTNTLEGPRYRPTAINFYQGPLESLQAWWASWLAFMFDDPNPAFLRLKKIPRSKYPALTEEEEAMSIPLQTLALAIFDAVLVDALNEISGRDWISTKELLGREMGPVAKTRKTLALIKEHLCSRKRVALVCLQEVGPALADLLGRELPEPYELAALAGNSPQASAIVVDTTRFPGPYTPLQIPLETQPGDLALVRCSNGVVLGSFHGDTNGLQTLPVVNAIADAYRGCRIILGVDANAHADDRASRGRKLSVTEFLESVRLAATPPVVTTFNARTYLQPQLQKAVAYEQRHTSPLADRNPKDYVCFSGYDLRSSYADNTGKDRYIDRPFPTLDFPSDHALLHVALLESPPEDDVSADISRPTATGV